MTETREYRNDSELSDPGVRERRFRSRVTLPRLVLAWALGALLLYLFWFDLIALSSLSLILKPVLWSLALLVLGLTTTALVIDVRERGDRRHLPLLLAFTVWSGLIWTYGDVLTTRVWYWRKRPEYDAKVNELRRTLPTKYPRMLYEFREQGHYVAAGPPLRVAFRLPDGLLDNYRAFVFDASGAVMRINTLIPGGRSDGRAREAYKSDSLVNLFDGQMFECRQYGRVWYLCAFS